MEDLDCSLADRILPAAPASKALGCTRGYLAAEDPGVVQTPKAVGTKGEGQGGVSRMSVAGPHMCLRRTCTIAHDQHFADRHIPGS